AKEQLALLQDVNRQLTQNLEAAQRQVEEEHQRAERERAWAGQIADAVKEIHGSVFSGDVYAQIVKACIGLAQARRGLFISSFDNGARFEIRAANGLDTLTRGTPPAFIREICE